MNGMRIIVALALVVILAGVAWGQTETWPPPGYVDISVPILAPGDSTNADPGDETEAGAFRAYVPKRVDFESNNSIPSILDPDDPHCGWPAVQYARITVRVADLGKFTKRIPEDQVPASDLLFVSLARARRTSAGQQSGAARFQAASDTIRIQNWFDQRADQWKTAEGKKNGGKVLRYIHSIGATQLYCDFLARRYELEEERPVAAETGAH